MTPCPEPCKGPAEEVREKGGGPELTRQTWAQTGNNLLKKPGQNSQNLWLGRVGVQG